MLLRYIYIWDIYASCLSDPSNLFSKLESISDIAGTREIQIFVQTRLDNGNLT